MQELVELRHKKALAMGYSTHAAFITEDRMAGSATKVAEFLGELGTKLRPLFEREMAALRALKAEQGARHAPSPPPRTPPLPLPPLPTLPIPYPSPPHPHPTPTPTPEGHAEPLGAWDRTYYCKRIEERDFKVDHETLKQYFPLERVTSGLLQIYQDLLGLTFTPAPEVGNAAWHEAKSLA